MINLLVKRRKQKRKTNKLKLIVRKVLVRVPWSEFQLVSLKLETVVSLRYEMALSRCVRVKRPPGIPQWYSLFLIMDAIFTVNQKDLFKP